MIRHVITICAGLLVALAVQAQPQPQWFAVNMNCTYTPEKATCTIQNNGSIPMFCNLRADGQLANNQVIYTYLNDWVPPGQFRYVYVYTSPPYPRLVGALGGGQCHF
ncbi:hypothetical protein MTYP_01407 [Methylophilaceae bacterium]|nr:hypothetical protein MTYP_01407 [Methylophilaceae bacterium]